MYEELARFAFNCNKGSDPWGRAKQDSYSSILKFDIDGMRILSRVFIALILKTKDTWFSDKLVKIEERVWKIKSQVDIVNILEDGVKFANEFDFLRKL